MKNNITKYIFASAFLFCAIIAKTEISSPYMHNTGDQSVHSIVLRHGWLYYMSTDGEVILQERISDVRTIVFSANQSTTTLVDVPEEKIRIYPNPVQNILYIESASVPAYQIFDIDGRRLHEGENNSIDVSILNTGTYLLVINNQTFKFIKQ